MTATIELPVVRTHRHTARKGLLISSSALGLSGVTDAEGNALLPFSWPTPPPPTSPSASAGSRATS
ncbi:MAG TPA: hypothetical protein VGL60_03650 [Acidimicrobiales bacterium]